MFEKKKLPGSWLLNSDSCLDYSTNYKPPLEMLNLMPKSASGPPGLCDAVSMMPPSVLYLRITHDTAGVDIMPFCATITLATCHVTFAQSPITYLQSNNSDILLKT